MMMTVFAQSSLTVFSQSSLSPLCFLLACPLVLFLLCCVFCCMRCTTTWANYTILLPDNSTQVSSLSPLSLSPSLSPLSSLSLFVSRGTSVLYTTHNTYNTHNTIPHTPHTPHTPTHSHSLTLTHTHTHSHSHTLTHTHSHTHTSVTEVGVACWRHCQKGHECSRWFVLFLSLSCITN